MWLQISAKEREKSLFLSAPIYYTTFYLLLNKDDSTRLFTAFFLQSFLRTWEKAGLTKVILLPLSTLLACLYKSDYVTMNCSRYYVSISLEQFSQLVQFQTASYKEFGLSIFNCSNSFWYFGCTFRILDDADLITFFVFLFTRCR
jgi:hypothetical protein